MKSQLYCLQTTIHKITRVGPGARCFKLGGIGFYFFEYFQREKMCSVKNITKFSARLEML